MATTDKTKKGKEPARECANCGAREDDDTKLSNCARCGLVAYCSKPCQAQHWKRKPTGHKFFCVKPEDRRPSSEAT